MKEGIESDHGLILLHYSFAIIFSICFGGFSLLALLIDFPLIVKHQNQVVETNLVNLLPFLAVGFVAFGILVFKILYFRPVIVYESGINILGWRKNKVVKWGDIRRVKQFNASNNQGYNTYFMISTTEGKTFFTISEAYDKKKNEMNSCSKMEMIIKSYTGQKQR